MHRIQGWTGLRAAVIALGLVAWTATGATASPLSYTTSGQVDPTTGVVGHQRGQLRSAEQRQLCRPQHGPNECEPGELCHRAARHRTYRRPTTNTPFQISLLPASYGSTTFGTDAPVVSLTGVLNGTVSGPSNSTVTATFNSVSPSSISLGSGNGTAKFSLPNSFLLAPSTSNNGTTSAQGLVTSSTGSESPVPEPSTIALFLTTVGGLGLRRYVLSRRRSARA